MALDWREVDSAVQQEDVIRLLLALQSRSRDAHDSDPVRQAVACKHPGALELLLRRGYSAEGQGGVQLLRTLVEAGFASKESDEYRMAELLLRYGIQPDDSDADADMDRDSCMPLLGLAARCQCIIGVELLLSYGADPNKVNQHGKNALHAVCESVCPFQPLSALPIFPDIQGSGSFAELLGVDAFNLPSLQGSFDNVFWDMPLEIPPLPSLAESAARAQPLPASDAADPLRSANVFHSLQDRYPLQTRVQHGSDREARTKSTELLPRDTAFSKTSQIMELLLRQGANACARDERGQTPVDLLPWLATHLRAKLQRAEGWLRRQHFMLACSPLQRPTPQTGAAHGDEECSESAVTVCLGSSNSIESIASFL
eukprot:TRINITY_DN15286_c0_g1_i1.p1 TRINITY_DN15286_c0_g1~~TRINITY_DN15286_c0_g1_i1.p1  ORF type:complete len:426 (-),score=68.07 TRINITY_DN15286_c0_g1_i1:408-1520(-)